MKPTLRTVWIAVVALFAVLATACDTGDPERRSTDPAPESGRGAAPKVVPIDTTGTVTSIEDERPGDGPTSRPATGTEPPNVSDNVPGTDPDIVNDDDTVDVTIYEIGVSTVLPSGWTPAPGGGFTDGTSTVGALAIATAEAGESALDGFEPFGAITAGGRGWELHAQQTGDLIVGLALTEIGDLTYGIVLQAPAELAESQLETVVVPALEAFEVTDAPIGSDPFQGMEVDSVDIGGHAVAYVAGGTGTPTVVFEAGLGSNGMDSWALVAPDVADHARVFAYDRPGYGGSDLTESPRDAATMVEDLRQLLATTGHEPPYLLVGHSLGGTLMDLFARTHPDEVAGLVLVDSRHHEYTERCVAQFGPAECDVPTDEEVAGVAQPILGEWRALPYTEAQLSLAPPLTDMPLAVIVADIAGGSPETFELWRQTQQDYADQVRNSHLIVAEDSDHAIPARQPHLIIDTIIQLIGASR